MLETASGLQRLRTPEPLRSRTFAAGRALVQTAVGLGTVVGGVLVSTLGSRGALLGAGGAGLAAARPRRTCARPAPWRCAPSWTQHALRRPPPE